MKKPERLNSFRMNFIDLGNLSTFKTWAQVMQRNGNSKVITCPILNSHMNQKGKEKHSLYLIKMERVLGFVLMTSEQERVNQISSALFLAF